MSGKKFDTEKPMLDLVPPEAIYAIGAIMTHGAEKYGRDNWLEGMDWGRVYAAAQRHLLAWSAREDLDGDSSMPHLWHALTNIAFLITYTELMIGNDNRREIKHEENTAEGGAANTFPPTLQAVLIDSPYDWQPSGL